MCLKSHPLINKKQCSAVKERPINRGHDSKKPLLFNVGSTGIEPGIGLSFTPLTPLYKV